MDPFSFLKERETYVSTFGGAVTGVNGTGADSFLSSAKSIKASKTEGDIFLQNGTYSAVFDKNGLIIYKGSVPIMGVNWTKLGYTTEKIFKLDGVDWLLPMEKLCTKGFYNSLKDGLKLTSYGDMVLEDKDKMTNFSFARYCLLQAGRISSASGKSSTIDYAANTDNGSYINVGKSLVKLPSDGNNKKSSLRYEAPAKGCKVYSVMQFTGPDLVAWLYDRTSKTVAKSWSLLELFPGKNIPKDCSYLVPLSDGLVLAKDEKGISGAYRLATVSGVKSLNLQINGDLQLWGDSGILWSLYVDACMYISNDYNIFRERYITSLKKVPDINKVLDRLVERATRLGVTPVPTNDLSKYGTLPTTFKNSDLIAAVKNVPIDNTLFSAPTTVNMKNGVQPIKTALERLDSLIAASSSKSTTITNQINAKLNEFVSKDPSKQPKITGTGAPTIFIDTVKYKDDKTGAELLVSGEFLKDYQNVKTVSDISKYSASNLIKKITADADAAKANKDPSGMKITVSYTINGVSKKVESNKSAIDLSQNIDCEGEWEVKTGSTCDANTKTINMIYNIKTQPYGTGKACEVAGGTVKSVDCSAKDCVGTWGEWGACDPATSTQTRRYKITKDAEYGGKACPVPETRHCDQDCDGTYSGWSPCSGGKTTQTFTIIRPAAGSGLACPELTKTMSCGESSTNVSATSNTEPDTTTCQGTWGDWGDCVDGKQYRTYISTSGSNCPEPESRDCPKDYTKYYYIGGGVAVLLLIIIIAAVLLMGKKPAVPPAI